MRNWFNSCPWDTSCCGRTFHFAICIHGSNGRSPRGTLINRPGKRFLASQLFNHFLLRPDRELSSTLLDACIPPRAWTGTRNVDFFRVIRTLKLPRSNSTVIALFSFLESERTSLCIPPPRFETARGQLKERDPVETWGPRNLGELSNWDVGYFEAEFAGRPTIIAAKCTYNRPILIIAWWTECCAAIYHLAATCDSPVPRDRSSSYALRVSLNRSSETAETFWR